jgi:hypothetical protein
VVLILLWLVWGLFSLARVVARVDNVSLVRDYSLRFKANLSRSQARFFDGDIFLLPDKEFVFVFVSLDILVVKFWLFTLLACFGSWLLFGFGWFVVVLGVISASGYFWSSFFLRWLFKRGLRRFGYRGEVVFYG